jgi:AraC-like DNA-binding protein
MTLRTIRFAGHLDGVMTPSEDFVVQWTTTGSGTISTGNEQIRTEPGRPQLWPQQGAAFSYDDYDQRIVQINRAALETVAAERGSAPGALQLDHTVRPDERALQVWRSSVQLISHTVMDQHASPLLQAEMGRLGALALLELYPVVSASLPAELLLPKNRHIRAAVEYVHEHAHLPITTNDIAQVANLSLRALQHAFHRTFAVTPNAYIRQVRLDRVRDALLTGDPATVSIADTARQWGFAHAGRFSAAYAARHGEYPRDTLRRA